MVLPKPKLNGKKVWYKDPIVLTLAGVGGAAGLYVLAKNKGGKAGTGEGQEVSGGAIPGAPYSSLGTDFYNAIEDSTSSLQDKLTGLTQSVQDVNLQISKLPTSGGGGTGGTPSGGTGGTGGGPSTRPPIHNRTRANALIQGTRITSPETLSQLAARVSASKSKTGIKSTLDFLISKNPSLYAKYGANKPIKPGSIALIPVWR